EVIQAALLNAGIPPDTFDALRLEGSSPLSKLSIVLNRTREVDTLREALNVMNLPSAPDGLESLPLAGEDSKMAGVLRYRYSCAYIHRALIREYFEREWANPDQTIVVRVSEPVGEVVYENAPTSPETAFEVKRVMTSPSFQGLKLHLRYKDRSLGDE